MEIPNDTILDLDPETRDIPEKARRLLKALYLGFPLLKETQEERKWTATQLINAAETLRREGLLQIKVEERVEGDYRYNISLTPTGAVEAFLAKEVQS